MAVEKIFPTRPAKLEDDQLVTSRSVCRENEPACYDEVFEKTGVELGSARQHFRRAHHSEAALRVNEERGHAENASRQYSDFEKRVISDARHT